jgi:AbiA family abortive infection protein
MYFALGDKSKKAYLQWFPFSRLSSADEQTILSEDFYQRFIKTGTFILFPEFMHRSENYILKGDGSFRDASLVSPILYLILQAIGKELSDIYTPVRDKKTSVYYAGNYKCFRAKYKQDYDEFFTELNASSESYQYFIKTDITNFFSSIRIDKLIDRIDTICNSEFAKVPQSKLQLYRALLTYCGNGRFPLIENSLASSYLATVVYLDEVDSLLSCFITSNFNATITDYKLVRYVDDLYILIASSADDQILHNIYNQIRNEYSSLLKEYGLALNSKKCCFRTIEQLNEELKKSLYDEFFNGEKHYIPEQFPGSLSGFLERIDIALSSDSIDVEQYGSIVEECFSAPGIEFTPGEVFNYFIYENDLQLQSSEIVDKIVALIKKNIAFISLDPKRLTVMIMKTHSDTAIKALLNQLFKRDRAGVWNSYDTTIAISYLIQSEFRHIDLIAVFSRKCKPLHKYYYNFCKKSFLQVLKNNRITNYVNLMQDDTTATYLYFLYLTETDRRNVLSAFAYYKNFFDRVSADLAFMSKYDNNGKKPNYKRFYKETELKKLYSSIPDSENIIVNAHKLRNENPLSHASAGLIDNESTSSDLESCISMLGNLLDGYMSLECV